MSAITPEQVKQFAEALEFLTPRQRKFFLKTLNKKQMRIFEVACFNLATNHRGLSDKQVTLLKKYKTQVELIASKNYKLEEKRRAVQKGGFVTAVLPILGTLLSTFL